MEKKYKLRNAALAGLTAFGLASCVRLYPEQKDLYEVIQRRPLGAKEIFGTANPTDEDIIKIYDVNGNGKIDGGLNRSENEYWDAILDIQNAEKIAIRKQNAVLREEARGQN